MCGDIVLEAHQISQQDSTKQNAPQDPSLLACRRVLETGNARAAPRPTRRLAAVTGDYKGDNSHNAVADDGQWL